MGFASLPLLRPKTNTTCETAAHALGFIGAFPSPLLTFRFPLAWARMACVSDRAKHSSVVRRQQSVAIVLSPRSSSR